MTILTTEEFERKVTSLCIRFRFVDHKEMKSANIPTANLSQQCGNESFVMKLLEMLISSGKPHLPWKLRWCGLFCTKFVKTPKNVISQFFGSSAHATSQQQPNYPSRSPVKKTPIPTPIKKQSQKKGIGSAQPSMLNFFNKQADK